MRKFNQSLNAVTLLLSLIAMSGVAKTANSQVSLSLDNSHPVFIEPNAGSTTYYLSGSVNVASGWTALQADTWPPYDAHSDSIAVGFSASFTNWFENQTSSFTGDLLAFSIPSTQAPGLYDVTYSGIPLYLDVYVAPVAGGAVYRDIEPFTVEISPYSAPPGTPEPGALAMVAGIGVTAVFGLRRRMQNQ